MWELANQIAKQGVGILFFHKGKVYFIPGSTIGSESISKVMFFSSIAELYVKTIQLAQKNSGDWWNSVKLIEDPEVLKSCCCRTLWKLQKFTLTEKKFRQINYLVISLVKTLLSRNFCQKRVRVNFRNFHTVHTVWKMLRFSLTHF